MSSAFGRVGKLVTPSDCKSDAYSTAGSSPACPTTADSAAINIDVPVQIRRHFYGFSTIRKILDKNLKFADGTERCEIRRDAYTMGGNVAVRVSPQLRAQQ